MKPQVTRIIRLMQRQGEGFDLPAVTGVSLGKDPYLVLVSCILSLRTLDKTTSQATGRLVQAADTPQRMLRLTRGKIQRLIYPVGFYRIKARQILAGARMIIEEYDGRVPDTAPELMRLPGVGLKTAHLVLGLGYGIPAICVDTHVHRISNRMGWVRTRTPEETEQALRILVPRRLWIDLNTIMVRFGQNVCVPVSPFCGSCRVRKWCAQRGVTRWRSME